MIENNEEKEVGDLLSSIRDILEEDQEGRGNVVDESFQDDESGLSDDDIIELSDDMRIEDLLQTEDEPKDSLGVGGTLDKVISSLDEAEDENKIQPLALEKTATEEFLDDAKALDEPKASDKPVFEAELLADDDKATEVAEEDNAPMTAAANDEMQENQQEANDYDNVSTGMISNFAKLFAQNHKKEESSSQSVVNIKELGQKDKTLESFVKDAIVEVIGEDISREWNGGANYRDWVEDEMKRQVATWVNDNMVATIEDIVRDEVRRVMAKVGS